MRRAVMEENEDCKDAGPSSLRLGPFVLTVAEGRLYRGGQLVPLGRRAMAR